MKVKRRLLAILFAVALMFVGQVFTPASKAYACTDDEEEEQPKEKVVFYVLKEGFKMPTSLTYDSTLEYYCGIVFGNIFDGSGNTTYFGDPAVFMDGQDIREFLGYEFPVPTNEQLASVGVTMGEGDKIVWYELKGESEGWRVNGIKIVEQPSTPVPTTVPEQVITTPVTTEPTFVPAPNEELPKVEEVPEDIIPEGRVEEPAGEPIEEPVEEPTEESIEEPIEVPVAEVETDDMQPEVLPKTGTASPISFYISGSLFVLAGSFMLFKKKTKSLS